MGFSGISVNSKTSRDKLAQEIIHYKNFEEVYLFIKSNDNKQGNRAAWTLTKVNETISNWLPHYFDDILKWLPQMKTQGIHRSIIKIVATNSILPEENESEWIDFCYEKLQNVDVDIAVKVYSMELLCKFCIKYPDLINEFKIVLEEGSKIYSKAYSGRAKKIYKKLG